MFGFVVFDLVSFSAMLCLVEIARGDNSYFHDSGILLNNGQTVPCVSFLRAARRSLSKKPSRIISKVNKFCILKQPFSRVPSPGDLDQTMCLMSDLCHQMVKWIKHTRHL